MCGIAGILGKGAAIENASKMVKVMRRRGPDDSGIWINENHSCCLGHTRLSIIDLSLDGHQPMHILNGRYSIVFNGEIYNYKEIKIELEREGIKFHTKSDTEVILWGWHVWQEKIIDKLRGMFAYCIWDQMLQKAYLTRDRLGIKPLLFHASEERIVFASSLMAMRASGLVGSKLNSEGFFDFLILGAVDSNRTMVEGIYKVPSGSIVTIERDLGYRIDQYWNPANNEKERNFIKKIDYPTVVKQTRIILEEACKYHMIADVPVGSFLSGGVDSTVITALMARNSTKKIKSFTIGFENSFELKNEFREAIEASTFIGTDHTNFELCLDDVKENFDEFIDCIDQPSIDGLNSFWVSKLAKEKVKVALSGLGGDEVFGGYGSFLLTKEAQDHKTNFVDKILSMLYNFIPNRFTQKGRFFAIPQNERIAFFRQVLNTNEIRKALEVKLAMKYSNDHLQKIINELDIFSDDKVYQYSLFETKGYLQNTLLRDTDALSMSQSVEVRPVFLDHMMVEYALAIPSNMKLKGGVLKSVLKDATSDLLPPNYFNKKKVGFSFPISSWLNSIFKERIIDEFTSAKSLAYFKREYLLFLLNNLQNTKLSERIWLIFIFLSWINKFELQV